MAKGPMRRPFLFSASVVTDIRDRTRRLMTYVGTSGLRFGLYIDVCGFPVVRCHI